MAAKGVRDAAKMNEDTTTKDPTRIWIGADAIDLKVMPMDNSSVLIAYLGESDDRVIIDTMISNPAANIMETTRQVRNLARTLAQVDPSTFGLLRCKGVIKIRNLENDEHLLQFKFLFEIPPKFGTPQSLRSILLSTNTFPLDERLNLAVKLTSSVLFVHTIQFVHKNIRPETIIVFPDHKSEIGAPFLAGFEKFRLDEGATWKSQDDLWRQNMCKTSPQVRSQRTNAY